MKTTRLNSLQICGLQNLAPETPQSSPFNPVCTARITVLRVKTCMMAAWFPRSTCASTQDHEGPRHALHPLRPGKPGAAHSGALVFLSTLTEFPLVRRAGSRVLVFTCGTCTTGDPEAPRKLVLLPRRLPPPERQQVVSSASRSTGGWRGRLAPPTPAAGSLQNEGCLWFTATDNPHLWSDSAVFKNGSFTSENSAGCWWERAVH